MDLSEYRKSRQRAWRRQYVATEFAKLFVAIGVLLFLAQFVSF